MRMIVDVYRGCSYYPDKTVRGPVFWVNRRIKALHEQGFECKVREVPNTTPNRRSTDRASGSLRAT
jgi:hypothetical protein